MKRILTISILLFFTNALIAQNKYFQIYTDSIELRNQTNDIVKDIEKLIQSKYPKFNFKGLESEIPNKFLPGQYKSATNKIYFNTWQVGGPPMEAFLLDIIGTENNGKLLAGLFFYGFFFPHEVGHALQHLTNKVPKNSYDAEFQANQLAVAYWRAKGKDSELQLCYQFAKIALPHLKNPFVGVKNHKKYLTENYNELIKDPYKYGYIQFTQIIQILEDKSLPKFNDYIKRYFK